MTMRLAAALLSLAALLAGAAVHAQAPSTDPAPNGAPAATAPSPVAQAAALIGADPAQVEASLGPLQRVRAPRRLPSGAVGSWRRGDVMVEGARFEETLFFAEQQLQQAEFMLQPGVGDSLVEFGALAAALSAEFGPPQRSAQDDAGMIMETATWQSAGRDVVLYRSGRPERPTVRIVVRRQQLRDASEL